MAFISLGSKSFGSSPTITAKFSYEKRRDGADMEYRVKIILSPLTGAHYYGYPISAKVSLAGSLKVTKQLKAASPSQWSSNIEYTTSWYTVSKKTTGTRDSTYNFSLAIDPAASVLGSISNFTIGNAINIPITKYSSGFTDSLTISVGGTTIKTINNISNGYDVSFSSTELTNIYKKIPSSTTATFTFKLTTKSGSTTVGTSTKTATGTIPSSVKPSISSVTVSEANSTTAALGVYVKNRSKLKFVISASAGSGSSISSYKTTVNGASYSGSTITTNTITASGTVTATITVTDKRGRTASTTKSVSVLNYANPYITTLTAFRCNSDGSANEKGTYMKISLTAGVTSLSGKNTYSYKIQYKKSSVSSYTTINVTGQDQTCTYSTVIAIESTSSYDIKATASDYFTSVTISAQPVPSVFRTMHFRAGGHGIGLGKMAEYEDVLDIGFETMFTGGIRSIEIPSGANLNNYKTPGFYSCQLSATAATLSNCPTSGNAFGLRVERTNGVIQTIHSYQSSNWMMWKRSLYGSTWGPWYRIPTYASFYPVGSVIITSTNSNPSSSYEGSWSLIDKELAPIHDNFSNVSTNCFTPKNLSSYNFMYAMAGHSGFIVLYFTPSRDMNDDTLVWGTVNWDALGVTRIAHSIRVCGWSDGGNSMFMSSLIYDTGEIQTPDIIPESKIAAGQTCWVTFNFVFKHDWMIDSKCNKFYWKRTA